jgi:methyl-accepting chemotaxis protein
MHLSVRGKLLASFATIFLLSVAIGVLALVRLNAVSDQVSDLARHVVPATENMGEATTITNKVRKDQMHYVLSSVKDRPGVLEDLAGDDKDLKDVLATFPAGSPDAKDAAKLEAALNAYIDAAKPYKAMADRGALIASGDFLSAGAPDKAWDEVKAAMASWQKNAIARAAATAERAEATAASTRRIIIGALVLARSRPPRWPSRSRGASPAPSSWRSTASASCPTRTPPSCAPASRPWARVTSPATSSR